MIEIWKIDKEKNRMRDRERSIKRERGKKRGSQVKLKKSDDPTNIDNNNSNMRELIMKIPKYSCLKWTYWSSIYYRVGSLFTKYLTAKGIIP